MLAPAELSLLPRGSLSEDQRWEMIADLAINEGWSFTFFPDDSVRFAKLKPEPRSDYSKQESPPNSSGGDSA